MMKRRIFPQPDLFETPPPKLIDQLRVLLTEAMATPHAAGGTQDQWEAGDDEDHA